MNRFFPDWLMAVFAAILLLLAVPTLRMPIGWRLPRAPRRRVSESRYMPHQGKRECARRMAQMARGVSA